MAWSRKLISPCELATKSGALVLFPVQALDSHSDNVLALGHQCHQLLAGGIGLSASFADEDLAEPSDCVGIDRIILGTPAGRLCEVAHPLGADDQHPDTLLAQGRCHGALVAPARLHHGQPNTPPLQFLCQCRAAGSGVHRRRSCRTANAPVEFVLGYVNADKRSYLWHPPAPFLARSGSKPMQLFGLKEEGTALSLALPRNRIAGVSRAQDRGGRLLQQIARTANLSSWTQGKGRLPAVRLVLEEKIANLIYLPYIRKQRICQVIVATVGDPGGCRPRLRRWIPLRGD